NHPPEVARAACCEDHSSLCPRLHEAERRRPEQRKGGEAPPPVCPRHLHQQQQADTDARCNNASPASLTLSGRIDVERRQCARGRSSFRGGKRILTSSGSLSGGVNW